MKTTASVHSAYNMTTEFVTKNWNYDPKLGKFYWKIREVNGKGDKIYNSQFAGKEAFTSLYTHGYPHSTKK